MHSLQRLNAAEKLIKGGATTLTSFMVIALIITILSVTLSEPSLSVIAMINALLGSAIGLPLSKSLVSSVHTKKRRVPDVGKKQSNREKGQ